MSGDEVKYQDDKVNFSGEEVIFSGEEVIFSGEQVKFSGEQLICKVRRCVYFSQVQYTQGVQESLFRITDIIGFLHVTQAVSESPNRGCKPGRIHNGCLSIPISPQIVIVGPITVVEEQIRTPVNPENHQHSPPPSI